MTATAAATAVVAVDVSVAVAVVLLQELVVAVDVSVAIAVVFLEIAVASIDVRNYAEADVIALPERVALADENGDGLLCIKKFAPNNGQDQKNGVGFSATMINDNRLGGNG